MASNYWIKLWIDILYDPKMGTMSDRLFRRTIQCFLLAGEVNQEGLLPSLEDMAWVFRMTAEELETDLVDLAKMGILDQRDTAWLVVNFEKRQSPVPAAERMKRMRESRRMEHYYNEGSRYELPDGDDAVTFRNIDTDTDTEADTDTEVVPERQTVPSRNKFRVPSRNSAPFRHAMKLGDRLGKENPATWAAAGFRDGWIWDYDVMKGWMQDVLGEKDYLGGFDD